MNDTDVIALLSDSFPGCMEDQPIAVTYEGQGVSLSSQPLLVSELNHEFTLPQTTGLQTTFTRKLKATRDWGE